MGIETISRIYNMELTSCEFTLLARIAEHSSTGGDGWLSPNWDAVLERTGFSIEQVNRMLMGLMQDRLVFTHGVQFMPPLSSQTNTGFLIRIGAPPKQSSPPESQRRTSSRSKAGYIYLMHGTGTEWYKIGRSVSPQNRVKHLDTKSPFEIELIHSFWADDAESVERSLHEQYAEDRVNGEWFALSDDDVNWLCSISKEDGILR